MTISPACHRGKNMIDEEETFKQYGYHSYDLKPQSHKKIVTVCDDCGKVRVTSKRDHFARCRSCAKKGERHPNFSKRGKNSSNWKGGLAMRICEECEVEFPISPAVIKRGNGKFCSPECYGKWRSKHFRGEDCPFWKGGASFEPYCEKFNNEFKEDIRDKFDRVCFLCGKTEEDNGKRLSVHHVNGNKNCGCDDDETCQFVPLCVGCHSKVHSKKVDWEAKIKTKMKNQLSGWGIYRWET